MFPSNHHAYSRFDRPRFDRGFGRSRSVLKVRGFSARGRGFDRGDRSHHRHVPGFHYGSSPYGAPQSTPLTCYGCGRPGHKQTECPMNPRFSQGSAQVPQAQAHHAGPPNSGRGNAPSGRGQPRGRGRFGWYEDLSFSKLVASHVCLEWGPGIETFVCEDTPNVLMNMQDGHVYAFVFQPRKAHEVLSEYNALKMNARPRIMEGRRNESVALKSAQGEEKVVAPWSFEVWYDKKRPSISMVRKECPEAQMVLQQVDEVEVEVATGDIAKVAHQVKLRTVFKSLPCVHNYYVLPKLAGGCDVLLGMDFLKRYKAQIDVAQDTCTFWNRGRGVIRLGLRNGTEWGRDGGCTATVSKPVTGVQ
jgi:hypothetical protein